MQKTIIYLVLLVVLGFGVWYFLFSDRNVFGVDEAGFTVKDTAAIYKIYMADKKGQSILLERKDNGWVVNGEHTAIQGTVIGLLGTINKQVPQYPVPENMHNAVIKSLAAKGVKVELYNKSGKKIKVFYVSGQVGAMSGSYMLIDGAKRPYVVQVAGFEGYISPRYSTDIKDWRDRTIFNVKDEDIRKISVEYPSEPNNNFTLTRSDDGKVMVTAIPEIMQAGTYNARRAGVYAKYFEKLSAEGVVNGTYGLNTIISQVPKRCTIEVTTTQGSTNRLDIYWMPVSKRSKNLDVPDPDIPDEYDSDRFYGVTNNFKDTVIIQRYSFDKVFRKGYEFYSPDEDQKQWSESDTIFAQSVKIGGG